MKTSYFVFDKNTCSYKCRMIAVGEQDQTCLKQVIKRNIIWVERTVFTQL